ncbi:prostatic acid phosphatase-like protein [Dinothrombium tinctorium]|uniref:Prostatic acid phosphatase-like protein n=1 Tax=Dinothrombium tinctorium TaxID=1965070 RepID=A0A3S3NPG6_9ACAR|nr:prostatic acid phosphatase-like protein [Dinothrombium tinctorium]
MNQPLITNWPDKPDLDQLNEVVRRLLSYIFDTHHLQRLTADIFDNLSSFIKEIKTVFNNSMREVHDTTVASVLNALGVYDMQFPPYGATLMFEFYEKNFEQKQMKVYYLKNSESENPELLKLPVCNYE